ncbi:HtaA domain-containing protein [Streptomyces coeruleoprunus]|uniref:HtaA domain-containing protein n=1 Tax=Streptomyces coeruleoprunus TaxID=285563 RepID=A0ABV9X647_9ACTN
MRRTALAAAVATAAAALGASALALPATAAPTGAAAPAAPVMNLKDGVLDWGVKESFRTYLASPFAHGTITTADGATQAAGNGVFRFVDGTGTYDTGTHATATAFRGSVRFQAHGGVLDIKLSDLKLTTKGSADPSGEITADVVTKNKDGAYETRDDVAIAALDMTGVRPGRGQDGAMVFRDIPAKLTKGGAEAFAGYYKEGDPLDPATLTVKAGAPSGPATPTTPTSPSGTPTPSASTSPSPSTTPGPTPSPTPSPTLPPAGTQAPTAVADARLTWGVKAGWRTYVRDTCGGAITPTDGATSHGTAYAFRFRTADVNPRARTADADFTGAVRFACPAHTIDWTIGDLKVRAKGDRGTLLADVTGANGTKDDVEFADLDLRKADYTVTGGLVSLKNVPATLTADGAAQFAGPGGAVFYRPGTAIDPVTVVFSLDKDTNLPPNGTTSGGTTSGTTGGSTTTGGTVGGSTGTLTSGGTVGGATGSLATTGSGLPLGAALTAAGATAAAGAAVLVAVRRRTA